jgi:hypothetical protein
MLARRHGPGAARIETPQTEQIVAEGRRAVRDRQDEAMAPGRRQALSSGSLQRLRSGPLSLAKMTISFQPPPARAIA